MSLYTCNLSVYDIVLSEGKRVFDIVTLLVNNKKKIIGPDEPLVAKLYLNDWEFLLGFYKVMYTEDPFVHLSDKNLGSSKELLEIGLQKSNATLVAKWRPLRATGPCGPQSSELHEMFAFCKCCFLFGNRRRAT